MREDGLKGDTPDVWTREQARIEIFTGLEIALMRAEAVDDYYSVLKIARQILRLQMEAMIDRDNKTMGKDTLRFTEMRDRIINLQDRYFPYTRGQSKDPLVKNNMRLEHYELVREIQDLLDSLFHNNTVLGLNYRKKDNPSMAALKK